MEGVDDHGLDHVDEVLHHVVCCFLLVFVKNPPHGGEHHRITWLLCSSVSYLGMSTSSLCSCAATNFAVNDSEYPTLLLPGCGDELLSVALSGSS